MNFPGFIGPSYQTSSRAGDVERTVNMYVETIQSQQGAPNPRTLNRAPGLLGVFTVGGRTRGMLSLMINGISGIWTVQADRLFLLLSDYSIPATAGPFNIADDNGFVQMCADPISLALVSAGVLYIANGSPVTVYTPALSFTPRSVAFIQNWFVALADNGRQFYFMDAADANLTVAWDALHVQTAEADANDLVRLFVDSQILWVFGSRIAQPFRVGTDANAPFDPIENAVVAMGLAASASVVSLDNGIFFLGKNNDGGFQVIRLNGSTPARVSDYGVENAMAGYSTVEDAVAWTHLNKGHLCYRITFPTGNATWEYDLREQCWYEVLWTNPGTGLEEAHRGYYGCSAFNKTIVGDRDNGKIYEMSTLFWDDDGDRIHCLRRTPHIIESMHNVQYDSVQLVAQVGIGNGSGLDDDENDPQVRYRYSDDNGDTWSNELSRSLGQQGATRTRLIWDRGGAGRNRVFEMATSTKQGPIGWSGLLLDAEELLS